MKISEAVTNSTTKWLGTWTQRSETLLCGQQVLGCDTKISIRDLENDQSQSSVAQGANYHLRKEITPSNLEFLEERLPVHRRIFVTL